MSEKQEVEPRMNADKHGLLYEDETNQIIGCARSLLLLRSLSPSSPIHPLLTESQMKERSGADKHGFLKKREAGSVFSLRAARSLLTKIL